VITALILGFTGPSIGAALAFALSLIALASLVSFAFSSQDMEVTTTVKKLRAFKQETKTVPLFVHSRTSRQVPLTLLSVSGTTDVEGELRRPDDGSMELLLKSPYAGRSEGLIAIFQTTDPLGLFAKQVPVHLNIIFESLPIALCRPAAPSRVYPVSYGENPAGRKGPGLELYGVGKYQTDLDPRDIMWKKAAGRADETLPLREREANVRNVSVMIAVKPGSEEKGVVRADLVAEAIACVGRQVLLAGSPLEITLLQPPGQRPTRVLLTSMRELADATLLPWTMGGKIEPRSAIYAPSDLLIIGPEELAWATSASKRFRRTLLVSDGILQSRVPGNIAIFSGKEDLANLVMAVVVG
jgi:uncharacterized protein (DUF58 family)